MLVWGNFCYKYGYVFKGLMVNELMVVGVGGGLVVVFNVLFVGVIFVIEELGWGMVFCWGRCVVFGVFVLGFILVVIEGNNFYFL